MVRTLFGSLLLMLGGCSCGGGGGADAGRVVEVVRFRTFVSAAGREDVPFDLSTADLSAIVTDDGGARVIYPELTGAGAATFRDVPDGGFVLSLAGYNLVTNEPRLDLGVVTLGRASAALTDDVSTVLALDVTGLQPWQPYSDVLQLTAANAGYLSLAAQAHAGAQPDAGARSALFAVEYWQACSTQRGQLAPLIDADAGDVAVLTQLVSGPVGDAGLLELRTVTRSAALPAFSIADHAVTPLAAALAPVATQEHVSLDFRQSAFDAERAAVHASASAISSTVTVSALPYSGGDGFFTPAPELAVLRPQQLSADVALDFDTGNPFPPAWPLAVSVRYVVQVEYAFPDGGSRALTTGLFTQALLATVTGAPIRPRVTPPRQVTVEGADGSTRAQISRVPVISWEPPATGAPTSYGVTVFHFSRVGSGPVIAVSEEAFFETTARSLKLPFGEVTPGGEYVFGVTAFDAPGAEVTKRPFKGGFPFGAATALTALLRVDPG